MFMNSIKMKKYLKQPYYHIKEKSPRNFKKKIWSEDYISPTEIDWTNSFIIDEINRVNSKIFK